MTPLLLAAKQGDVETSKLLLKQGASVESPKGPCGSVALHLAANNGHMDTVQLLIRHGCNVCFRDDAGMTALHLACQNGHTHVAAELLESGAEKHPTNILGETPLLLATKNNQMETVCLLLYWKVYPSFAAVDGTTAVHIAAMNGSVDLLNVLLSSKADPHALNSRYETPLFLAARNGHASVVDRLLQFIAQLRGLDIDVRDAYGRTALHAASSNGHYEIVDILLAHGADPTLPDSQGCRPIDLIDESRSTGSSQRLRGTQEACSDACKHKLMDGVVTANGFSYEAGAMTKRPNLCATSSATRLPIAPPEVGPNTRLKSSIEAWTERMAMYAGGNNAHR